MSAADRYIALAISAATLAGFVAAWLRWVRPRIRSAARTWVAFRDTMLGRDPLVDSITGREIEPAQPAMGVRLANVESAVSQLADQHRLLEDHESRIKALEDAAIERVAARADSVAAWRAMEAAAKSTGSPALPDPKDGA